jgi:hypothetical protein
MVLARIGTKNHSWTLGKNGPIAGYSIPIADYAKKTRMLKNSV